MDHKKIADKYRNTRLHFVISKLLEKFEMAGFTISYSMAGEDLIIKHIFGKNKRDGVFVDVGCNNPIQNNNTFKLYLKGWRGINIDGNENLVKKFKKLRPHDINLNLIISDKKREIFFYQDNDRPEFSTVTSAGEPNNEQKNKIKKIKYDATTLEDIFDTYLKGRKIDLLTIDVEGHDLEVLKGNNFEKYRPAIICIEFNNSFSNMNDSEINKFIISKSYAPLVFSYPNIYYKSII